MPEFKKKSVRFDHLEPTYTSYSTQSEIQTYDLEDMLKQIARAEPMDTKKIIDGDSYIFHVCKYHDEDNLWELRVLRIREKILPGILHDDGMKLRQNRLHWHMLQQRIRYTCKETDLE